MLKIAGWNVDLLITITTAVRGAMHKQALEALQKLKIPPQGVKKLMEYIHQTPHIPCPKHKSLATIKPQSTYP